MNILPRDKRILALKCLVEGMSMRATSRITDVSRQTLSTLLVSAGRVCAEYQDAHLRDLPCRRVQLDEIWQFVYAREKNVARAKCAPREAGDVWTWVAICQDTKLVPSWRIGDRSSATAIDFVEDLKTRLAHRIQLTSDGHGPYIEAVERAFGADADYAMLVKEYGGSDDEHYRRYTGSHKHSITGSPREDWLTTSHVERQNLTMRMSMRRTNGFSKKVEMLHHALSLHCMHYNFCRLHQTLRVTPAMAADVTRKLWEMRDIVELIEARDPKPGPRGPHKKRAKDSN